MGSAATGDAASLVIGAGGWALGAGPAGAGGGVTGGGTEPDQAGAGAGAALGAGAGAALGTGAGAALGVVAAGAGLAGGALGGGAFGGRAGSSSYDAVGGALWAHSRGVQEKATANATVSARSGGLLDMGEG